MNKIIGFFLLALMFDGCYQSASAEERVAWVARKSLESESLSYYVYMDECIVADRGLGGGIMLVAFDRKWRGRTLVQTTILQRQDDGGIKKIYFYSVLPPGSDSISDENEIQTYKYDIFDVQCRSKVAGTPQIVMDFFHNYYDISR